MRRMLLGDDKSTTCIWRGCDPQQAIGFAVYSNSERSAELFRWMFELLWNDRISSEESNKAYKMEQEFVNIAAYELRSPVQSILGFTELLLADPKYREGKEHGFIDAIHRNSIRLNKLTQELLDLTRVDNQTFELHKQKFNLNQVALLVIQDIQKRKQELDFRINNGYKYNGDAKIILLPSLTENEYDNSIK
jgi:signal transduction histidine kinase